MPSAFPAAIRARACWRHALCTALSLTQAPSTGYEHRKALGYSVFLGLVGADRFYLGYPGIAVFKFMTCGFFFLGYYVDAILIGLQLLKPADGSDYAVRLNGPVYAPTLLGDATYYVPLDGA